MHPLCFSQGPQGEPGPPGQQGNPGPHVSVFSLFISSPSLLFKPCLITLFPLLSPSHLSCSMSQFLSCHLPSALCLSLSFSCYTLVAISIVQRGSIIIIYIILFCSTSLFLLSLHPSFLNLLNPTDPPKGPKMLHLLAPV